ncbi:MAG: MBOAT family protein [Candidatus Magnetomorum sp.]|nr:MBOAT family protein [Candidatus Magnetomorum sp.]
MPLAISFYTFQQIAFLVDTYKAESNKCSFLYYCLFVSFFPQLIAGPIIRHFETIPQYENKKIFTFNYSNISIGMTIFFIGLFKKVVLADGIAPFATSVFNAASRGETIFFIESWCGSLSYTFQLYFDFSGYSDMAIGLARMFNIFLPVNFYSPYRCTSIIDFWKQWHITLSLFLRDYLYIPLGGNRKGSLRKYTNLMITMLLGGLWHGAGWTFVIWGGLHGAYLCTNHLWRFLGLNEGTYVLRFKIICNFLSLLLTFISINVAWIFFRSDDIFAAKELLFGLIGFNGVNLPPGYLHILGTFSEILINLGVIFQSDILPSYTNILLWMVILSCIVWGCPNTYELMKDYKPALHPVFKNIRYRHLLSFKWRPSVLWAIFISCMFTISILFLSSASEFLYFNF